MHALLFVCVLRIHLVTPYTTPGEYYSTATPSAPEVSLQSMYLYLGNKPDRKLEKKKTPLVLVLLLPYLYIL